MQFIFFLTLSTLIFAGLILILVLLLFLVEAKIAQTGDRKIIINDQKQLTVASGKSLLRALADQKIFLPSACGGKGTCATCKCQVWEGGGEVLPTETGQLTRKEIKSHYRLSCQVKVRENIKVKIPAEIFSIKQYECGVVSNRNVASFIKELVLGIKEPFDFKPGQYVQMDVPEYQLRYKDFDIDEPFRRDWEQYKYFDLVAENEEPVFRAYSMANYPAEKGKIILNVRIATPPPNDPRLPPGIASSYIFNLKSGDPVKISGPYGEFLIKDSNREMVYIGGGAGMAPLRSHIFYLLNTRKSARKISYWYGARSKKEIFYQQDFEELQKTFKNFSFHVALSEPLPEDGWNGPVGFIHQVLLDEYLKNHAEPEEVEYYICGPPLMLSAVLKMLDSLGVPPESIAYDDFGG